MIAQGFVADGARVIIAARKAAEDAKAAAAQRDRTLLATYLSVADIERLRDHFSLPMIYRSVFPFVMVMIFTLIVLMIFPEIALWLPERLL